MTEHETTLPKENPKVVTEILGIIADSEILNTAYVSVVGHHRDEFSLGGTGNEVDLNQFDQLRQKYPVEFGERLREANLTREQKISQMSSNSKISVKGGNLTINSLGLGGINYLGQAFPLIAREMGLTVDPESLSGKKRCSDFSEPSQEETERWQGHLPSGQTVTAEVRHTLRGTQKSTPESLRYLRSITIGLAPTN